MSIALGVFLVGCGSNESDVRAKPKQRGESSHPNSPLEEHENTLEPALSSNVSPSVNAPPDVEELAIVLEKLFEGDVDERGRERYLDEIERLFKDHPDHATLIIDTFVKRQESELEWYFTIATALVDYLSRRDPMTALKYASRSEFKTAFNLSAPITALTEKGDRNLLIEALPLVDIPEHRYPLLRSIGALIDPQQLLALKELIDGMSFEDRQGLMAGYQPEHYPRFEEFDDWPLKSLLGDALRPNLARSLALRMENITNAEDAQTMLKQFEGLPGYTDTDREVLEQEWYHRYLQDDQDNLVWALNVMQDKMGNLANSAVVKIYKEQSGEAAFSFVDQLHDGKKDQGLRGVMFAWYRYDSKALSEYLVTLPEGETRRLAALRLADLLERDDHTEEAMHWRRWAEEKPAR